MLLPTTLPTAMSRSPRSGGHDRRRDFGRGRACRNDGQSDHQLGYADGPRHLHGGVHQPVRAQHQQSQAASEKQEVQRHTAGWPPVTVRQLFVLDPFPPRLPDLEHDVGDEPREEKSCFPPGDAAIVREHPEQECHADHDRHFEPDELPGYDEGRDEGGEAEDEEHVEDVAADHVAHRDVGLPGERAAHADRHLGRAGAHRYDGQPDHERRDAEAAGKARCPADQQFGADDQQGETAQEKQERHGNACSEETAPPGISSAAGSPRSLPG